MAGHVFVDLAANTEYITMATRSLPGSRPYSGDEANGMPELNKKEYEQLAQFRYSLREFARATELEARKIGLTPQQYQLLLAIKGFPGREQANISELAERLQIRHNAVIGLVNRAEARGLVRRVQDADRMDRRVVQIHLTGEGEQVLHVLAQALRSERERVRAAMAAIQDHVGNTGDIYL